MLKVKVNKETCVHYGKCIALGGLFGLTESVTIAAMIIGIKDPTAKLRAKVVNTLVGGGMAALQFEGYVSGLKRLVEEGEDLESPWPIEIVKE